MSCQDKTLALLALLAIWGGDMLGWDDAGYNLLVGSPIYITFFLWLCQAMTQLGVESERFIIHPAHMKDPVFQSLNQTLTL